MVPGVEGPQQVDLSKAARRHPLTPSGMHFPAALPSSSPFADGSQQSERSDSGLDSPFAQHLSGVVWIASVKRKSPSNAGADALRTLCVVLVDGFIVNAMVFVVSTTRVLAMINARFAVRVFIVCTTPTATMGLRLTGNVAVVVVLMIVTTTLDFPSAGRRGGIVSVVLRVAPVGWNHPAVPSSGGGGRRREGKRPMDPNIMVRI